LTSRDTAGRSAAPALSRARLIARLGWREYRATYTNRVLLLSVLSRALLQVSFFALIGRTVAGQAGQAYAFTGGVMLLAVLPCVVQTPDVIVEDKWQRTLVRLRLGDLPMLGIMTLRSGAHLLQGLATSFLALAVLGPVHLGVSGTLRVLAVWPAVSVSAAGAVCLGMFLGAASLGKRGDVLLANTAQYLVVLCSGAVVAVARFPALDRIGALLPGTQALGILRAGDWHASAGSLLREAVVGIGWLALAQFVLVLQAGRARQGGFDDYT
jgi:ABC-2 type transport system permease protein